jgi:hypothetical protein
MLVIVEDAVFEQDHPASTLLALLHLCDLSHDPERLAPRHLLIIDPPPCIMSHPLLSTGTVVEGDCPALIRWLGRLDEGLRDEVTQTLILGQRLSMMVPDDVLALRVTAVQPTVGYDERTASLHRSLQSALHVLMQPLRVLLEHGVNDRGFVENVPSTERVKLQRAARLGWLRFEHAGGVGSMPELIRTMSAAERARLFVIADLDSDTPQPSGDALRVGAACRAHKPIVPHHIWERRAIENYIPREALLRYPAMRGAKPDILSAFREHVDSLWTAYDAPVAGSKAWKARYGLPLKKNRERDARGVGGFRGVPASQLSDLFDPKKRSKYIGESDWEVWLREEGTAAELARVVNEILRRL